MLKNRHFISYASTTLIYSVGIGLFVYIQQHTKVSTERSDEKVMQVKLTDFMPEQLPVEDTPVIKEEEIEVKEEEVKEPEPIKEPEPEKQEKVVEEKIPEPVIEKQLPLPKPVVEKPVPEKPKEKPQEKPKVKPKKKQEKPKEKPKKRVEKKKPVQKSSRASSKKSQANPNKVNQFYKRVRVKINQNKSYPKIAKRRRMQGSVKVTFTVSRSGNVSNIRLHGPKVFHNSARHAVKSAFPISVKNVPVSLPATVNITLRYQIR